MRSSDSLEQAICFYKLDMRCNEQWMKDEMILFKDNDELKVDALFI